VTARKKRSSKTGAKKRIRYFDGFAVRNIFPDMDIVESHSTTGSADGGQPMPFIPKDEIWVDQRFRDEKKFLLEVHRIEEAKRRWPYSQIRAYLRKKLTKEGPPPPFIVRSEICGRLTVRYVRGEIVRQYLDPAFIFGGHDLVYHYVPSKEIWIDIRQDPREIPFTLRHEKRERHLMSRGTPYSLAHRSATDEEFRRRDREQHARRGVPLRMRPFAQRAGYCGPASLKICCAFFSREYEERYLGELCRTTVDNGTDHADLIKAARTLGAKTFARSGGSLSEISYFLRRRLPVIVGWYSPSKPRQVTFDPAVDELEDHFSVVYHLTGEHIYLMDPETETGRRKMSLARFLSLWWDADGPNETKVDRWYLVISFDKKLRPPVSAARRSP